MADGQAKGCNRQPASPRDDTQIDRSLRRAFEETLNEPLPEKLTALIEQLRAQEKRP